MDCKKCKRGNLGYVNGFNEEDWKNLNSLKLEAIANHWPIVSEKVGRCETKYICYDGNWCYFVDSSD